MKRIRKIYIIIILTIGIFIIQSSTEHQTSTAPQIESAIYPEFPGEGYYHAVSDNVLVSGSEYYLVFFDISMGYVAYKYSCQGGLYFSCKTNTCELPFSDYYCGCAFNGMLP